jgi:uncharacterized protein
MNSEFMPLKLDAFREASAKRKISFSAPVSSFPRVSEMIPDSSSEVRVSLFFGVDEDKKNYIDLNLEGTLSLACQRCLGIMPSALSVSHRLRPVKPDYLDSDLEDEIEPVLMDEEGLIDVVEMVEEELITNSSLGCLQCKLSRSRNRDFGKAKNPEAFCRFGGIAK